MPKTTQHQQIILTIIWILIRAKASRPKPPTTWLNLVNRSLNSLRIPSLLHHQRQTLNLLSRQIPSSNLRPFKKTPMRTLTGLFQRLSLNQGLRRLRRQQPKKSKRRKISRIHKSNRNSTSKRNPWPRGQKMWKKTTSENWCINSLFSTLALK